MIRPRSVTLIVLSLLAIAGCVLDEQPDFPAKLEKAEIGKQIFFDASLSEPGGQSCGSCHSPATAFSDPQHRVVSEGAVPGRFTMRNAPSLSYVAYNPSRYFNQVEGIWAGGFFLDGRAITLSQQAMQPFLNPLEMNNHSVESLVAKLRQRPYFPDLERVFGPTMTNEDVLDRVAQALTAFEMSPEVSPFNSKYDLYLQRKAILTDAEMRGMRLFNDPEKANCAGCHISDADPATGRIVFTDFTYDNIGIPKNTKNPYYGLPSDLNPQGANYVDRGLGSIVNDAKCDGQFKVPTLRNLTLTAPYFHNGSFKTLEDVVHFYNARDSGIYGRAEVESTVNRDELGNLKLTPQEESDIVAFLKTLTDGYVR